MGMLTGPGLGRVEGWGGRVREQGGTRAIEAVVSASGGGA